MKFFIPLIVACLLSGCATICFSQSNQSITVVAPPGSTVLVTPSNAPAAVPVNITPPPRSQWVEQEMVMNLRQARFEAARLSALHSQRFEVLKVEMSASIRGDRDERGVLTGTFSPETNWIATVFPVRGTNEPAIRGPNREGNVELIFLFPVEVGSQIDINLRRNP